MKMKMLLASFAAALTMVAVPAQASFVTTHNGVGFTFNQNSSTQFTLRMQNALDATGDWAPAQWIDNLAFSWLGFGLFNGTLTPGSWAASPQLLFGSSCVALNGTGLCFEANPELPLTNDMLFMVNLTSGTLNLDKDHGPFLQVSFLKDFYGFHVPTHDTLGVHMDWVEPNPQGTVPEPASLALVGAALIGVGAASRKRKQAVTA